MLMNLQVLFMFFLSGNKAVCTVCKACGRCCWDWTRNGCGRRKCCKKDSSLSGSLTFSLVLYVL